MSIITPAEARQHPAFHNPHTASDLQTLERSLRDLLAPHLAPRDHLTLLNLACGRADETAVLAALLREKAPSAHLQGLDIRAAEIDTARLRWKDLPAGVSSDFRIQRGETTDTLHSFQDATDLVFLRHQNYWNDPAVWTRIFDQALHQLRPGGHLVITSYFDREHALALRALQKLGATLLRSHRNPKSRLLSARHAKSVDRHLAIFRKGEAQRAEKTGTFSHSKA
ncbi:MAG: class I SAM-dependent methyltransferase [Verrucomicrobiales bacterium]